MPRPTRRPWYVVVVDYVARSGKTRSTSSRAFATREEARRVEREYEATGFSTRIVEVPPPPAKPTKLERIDATVGDLPLMEPKSETVHGSGDGEK